MIKKKEGILRDYKSLYLDMSYEQFKELIDRGIIKNVVS